MTIHDQELKKTHRNPSLFRNSGDFDSNKGQENHRERKIGRGTIRESNKYVIFGAVSVCSPLSGQITLILYLLLGLYDKNLGARLLSYWEKSGCGVASSFNSERHQRKNYHVENHVLNVSHSCGLWHWKTKGRDFEALAGQLHVPG